MPGQRPLPLPRVGDGVRRNQNQPVWSSVSDSCEAKSQSGPDVVSQRVCVCVVRPQLVTHRHDEAWAAASTARVRAVRPICSSHDAQLIRLRLS